LDEIAAVIPRAGLLCPASIRRAAFNDRGGNCDSESRCRRVFACDIRPAYNPKLADYGAGPKGEIVTLIVERIGYFRFGERFTLKQSAR